MHIHVCIYTCIYICVCVRTCLFTYEVLLTKLINLSNRDPQPIELSKGSQGKPIRPIREYQWLLGLTRAYWEDLAPLVSALMAGMKCPELWLPTLLRRPRNFDNPASLDPRDLEAECGLQ